MAKTNTPFELNRKNVEHRIKKILDIQQLNVKKFGMPYSFGDLFTKNAKVIFGDLIKECSLSLARRSMADLAFYDKNDNYYIVDVKTHRLDTDFNMPNLTSVERLSRFYEDDKNYFITLITAYNITGTHIVVEKVSFVPIEFLSWHCLTIGALGWGQIQIANSNNLIIEQKTRKEWMIQLCDILIEFYPAEIGKIKERIEYFKKVKTKWLAKK